MHPLLAIMIYGSPVGASVQVGGDGPPPYEEEENLLLESGDNLLLESGDFLLFEG